MIRLDYYSCAGIIILHENERKKETRSTNMSQVWIEKKKVEKRKLEISCQASVEKRKLEISYRALLKGKIEQIWVRNDKSNPFLRIYHLNLSSTSVLVCQEQVHDNFPNFYAYEKCATWGIALASTSSNILKNHIVKNLG